MSKEEFLQQLSEHLMGNVREGERLDSLRYYREYIEEEIRAGKTEEEVLNSLGSAYGIAKSIIEAKGYDPEQRNDYEEYRGDSDDEIYREEADYQRKVVQVSGWKVWLGIAGIILVLFLILSLVFHVFAVLLPFLLPFLLILFVIKLFSNRS